MASVVDFIGELEEQLGKPYEWGAAGPDSFDCSGLIVYCLNQVGVDTGGRLDSATLMTWSGTSQFSVSEGQATQGAILHAPGHVAISMGDGTIIEAPVVGVPVRHVADYGGPNGGWNSAGTFTALEEDDMPTPDEIAQAVWNYGIGEDGTLGQNNQPSWMCLSWAHADGAYNRATLDEDLKRTTVAQDSVTPAEPGVKYEGDLYKICRETLEKLTSVEERIEALEKRE